MINPDKESLEPRLLAVERAIDAAVRNNFGKKSSHQLARHLNELFALILEEGEDLPICIKDKDSLASKALVMVDIAYACWINDEPVVPLPEAAAVNHMARMRLNPEHCKFTLEIARLQLLKYKKFLSLEAQALR